METINIISHTLFDRTFNYNKFKFYSILVFTILRNFKSLNNYLVANRAMGTYSLTSSLVASALGAWILFGPPSAATWGGLGAVLGYALGTAFPLFVLIKLGKK